ncbi:hypothetical protein U1Q18_026565 [Sarracenia purpurea var. burkii]
MYSEMVRAPPPASAAVGDYRMTCRRSSSTGKTYIKLPPATSTGGSVPNGGVPLKSKSTLQLKLRNYPPIFVLPTFLKKLSTGDWVSGGRNSANKVINWGMWNWKWYRCFIVPWSWTSRMISIYLFCLNFVAEAYEIPYSSFGYGCENVQKYYARVGHLRGEALKRNLNSIIARHQSLSYNEVSSTKQVWDALKILDAADFDKPEASSEV